MQDVFLKHIKVAELFDLYIPGGFLLVTTTTNMVCTTVSSATTPSSRLLINTTPGPDGRHFTTG